MITILRNWELWTVCTLPLTPNATRNGVSSDSCHETGPLAIHCKCVVPRDGRGVPSLALAPSPIIRQGLKPESDGRHNHKPDDPWCPPGVCARKADAQVIEHSSTVNRRSVPT